jgi:hypothetical protein
VTRAFAAALLAALLAFATASPALGKPRASIFAYDITSASLTEVVHFQGDGGPACARAGVCGYSGDVSYSFSGIQFGDAELLVRRTRHSARSFGFGEMQANGVTKATVNAPGAPTCSDQVLKRADAFVMQGKGRRVQVGFHPSLFDPNFVRTVCAGPSDDDLWHSGALPKVSFPLSRFERHRVVIDMASRRPFHAGPFTGTVSLEATVRLRRIPLPDVLVQLLKQLS